MLDLKIAVAQINSYAGNLEKNYEKIKTYILNAKKDNADLIVFPEFALTGFLMEGAFQKHSFLKEKTNFYLDKIANLVEQETVLIGFTDNKKKHSSIAVLHNKKFSKIIKNCETINVNNNSCLICLCKYSSNSVKKYNADIIIDCGSVSISRKDIIEAERKRKNIAKENNIPIIQVNPVGATDNISFSGESSVISANGDLIYRAKSFEEDFCIIKDFNSLNKINLMPKCTHKKYFTLDYEDDLERTYKILIQGIKDYFTKCNLKKAVLGLSGGLDSTICAVLLNDALGSENVLGVSMPFEYTSSESKCDAKKLAENLGIHFLEKTIKPMFYTTQEQLSEIFNQISENWSERFTKSYTSDNIQARSRAIYLWGIANEFASCVPIATSDKSEAYMGYATINGDMSGGFAPILDVTKTKLFALARWMNKNRSQKNDIPKSIILKKPGAELAINPKTGKTLLAEDALMPYEFMDEVIWRIENNHESYKKMLNEEFIYETKNKITQEQKSEWLIKFFKRMSTALYKGYIMPPSIITDYPTNNKTNYYQPITSSGMNYVDI